MSPAPGVRLGAYEIVALIGAGGMGEVYRAHDTRLGRDVAIKVLPDAFAGDIDRLARFKRESQVLASLNHSNIAAIYGIEETSSGNALILELVDGPTLAERIAQGPLPLDEALPIARQVADALEAAHEHGIIHRDLKPANIKVTPDGHVKVLDFGLAKAVDPVAGPVGTGHHVPSVSTSPTITSPAMTHGGMILGTAAYMSPEQAKGKAIDRRTDMWAFGCVLFEMLTGTRAFEGEDVSDTLAEILKSEPDLKKLPRNTPAAIERLLRRCLAKDRRARLSDAGVARLEIDEAVAAPVAPALAPPVMRPRRAPRVAAVLVLSVLAAAIGAAVANYLRPEPSRLVRRFAIDLPDLGVTAAGRRWLALSPDGSHLAYIGRQQLQLRRMANLDATTLPRTNGATGPSFSPDGRWLVFWQNGQLKKMDVAGGPAIPVCDTPSPLGTSWEDDGSIWFGRGSQGIWKAPADGGPPVQVIKVDATRGEAAELPQLLPGGEWLMFTLTSGATAQSMRARLDTAQVVAQSLRNGERKTIIAGAADARYVTSGHVVYMRQRTLMAAPIDVDRIVVTGPPVSIAEEVFQAAGGGGGISGGGISSAGQYALSSEGTLAYSPAMAASPDRAIVWVDRKGQETPIPAPLRAYVYPRLSPDGARVALDVRDQDEDIHVWDLARATLQKITFDPLSDIAPAWSPDGLRIAFASAGRGVFWQAADGSGNAEALIQEAQLLFAPTAFTPDGAHLIVNENQGAAYGIRMIAIADRSSKPLSTNGLNEANGTLSPDGRWMVYQSNESGSTEIYVRPFPNLQDGRWQISSGGGTRPVWRGNEIFYVKQPQPFTMMSVPVGTASGFTHGNAVEVFSGSYLAQLVGRTFDVTKDGQKFLVIKPAQGAATVRRIVIVSNWTEELTRSAPR